MICEINPEYREYVATTKHGKKILIGEMNKAVYGNVMSGILFYEKLAGFLDEQGFDPNPYDAYTWNKQVDGSQNNFMWTILLVVTEAKVK